jgi:A/G-specific adenine glycosylase
MNALQADLLAWYERNGRDALPWRIARNPYYTLVSEFMLQQTQVERVIPSFQRFIVRFPDIATLATASSAEVLRAWQGLGYNSRAVRLQQAARDVMQRFEGAMPVATQALRSLPGVGAYTASAIRAFAFDIDDVPVDTNLRRIAHRLFFGIELPPKASASVLEERLRILAPGGRAHDWNSAMMDLGAAICTARAPKCLLCPLRQECAAAPIEAAVLEGLRRTHRRPPSPQQALPFEQTTRYARGRIVDRLRALPAGSRISLLDLHADLAALLAPRSFAELRDIVEGLERDGLVARLGEGFALRD